MSSVTFPQLDTLLTHALEAMGAARDLAALEAVEVKFLGRKGELNALFQDLGTLKTEERKNFGQELNRVKREIEEAIAARRGELQLHAYGALAETEWIDITQPGVMPPEGHLHLTTQAIREITEIFERIGFTRVRYPEVDWEYFPFTGLNMPEDHPARDEWETFFVGRGQSRTVGAEDPADLRGKVIEHPKFGKMVLTPHSTNGDVHELEKKNLPLRIINITKCYRRQSDASHTPMFHQFDGLYVDQKATVTELKGVLEYFVHSFFGPERKTRLRPFHFRFTEPSFEVDISCGVCNGEGIIGGEKCRLCKSGWLELGGSGMLHPNVLRMAGIDPKKWSAFAFGWGVERNFLMKSGVQVDDLRLQYQNDLRFLKQF